MSEGGERRAAVTGELRADGMRIAVVVARFNELITRSLLVGAEDAWKRHGGSADSLVVAWVPGSFEIPVVTRELVASGAFDAVVCLGCLIRGATPHFDLLASSVSSSLQGLATEYGVPVIHGVLTTDSIEQALERAGTKAGNKGYDAVVTAIDTASVLQQLRASLR